MKNWILYGGIAVVVYAMLQKRQKIQVNVSEPVPVPAVDLSGAPTSSTDSCNLCDTVNSTVTGLSSNIGASPQIDSPAADPIIDYAVHRMDFTGPQHLAA